MHLYHWQMNKLSHFDEETNNFNATNHSTGVNDTLVKHWANRQFNSVRWTNKYYLSFSQHKTSPTDTTNPLPFSGTYKLGGGFKLFFTFTPKKIGKWFPFWQAQFSTGLVQPPPSRQGWQPVLLGCWNFFASGDGIFKALALLQRTLGSSIFGDSTGRDIVISGWFCYNLLRLLKGTVRYPRTKGSWEG